PRTACIDGRRDRRGVREHLLDCDVDPELRAACAAAVAHRRVLGHRDARRARVRPDAVLALPLPPRRLLRAALRRAAGRLDPAWDALHARGRLRGPGGAAGHDLRLALRLPLLRVARNLDGRDGGSGLLDVVPEPAAPARLADRRVTAELRARVRARLPRGALRTPGRRRPENERP